MSGWPKPISEECSSVAFYAIQPSPKAAEQFYRAIGKWFKDLGSPPDKISVAGPGHSSKLVSFATGAAKLEASGFTEVVVAELVSTAPDAKIWGRDYLLTASYDARSGRLIADVVARSSLATLSATSMLPIARLLIQELQPAYGIGYVRSHRRGPELYASGVGRGLTLSAPDREEALRISRWCDGIAEQVWRNGLLRDIYPWNFLTPPHLGTRVEGASLRDWISEDARRGSVSEMPNDVVLWEVPASSIPDVRTVLRDAHLIFGE
jgi:hypothetical protein